MRKIPTVLLAFFLSIAFVYGGGFQINDHSGRSVGMAFSVVANPTDASGIAFNPAAMTNLDGEYNFSLGASYIMPGAKFTGITTMNQQNTTEMNTWNFIIPHFFGTWKTPINNLNFGLGVFVPFGLGTEWPDNWVGRFLASKTYLETIEINPNIAYKFEIAQIPISLSIGYGFAIGNVELKQNISTFSPEPILTLKGDGTASTFNFGLLVEPMKNLKIGASYRNNIKINYDGNTSYENIAGLESIFQESTGKTTINFPNDFRLGVAYIFSDNFSIEAGMNYMGWSSYDTLKIDIAKAPGNPPTEYISATPRNYKDAITYRIGGEYLFDNFAIRAGFYYDPLAVSASNVEPVLPESNRYCFSVGFGYKPYKDLKLDLGYLGIIGSQTNVIGNPNQFDGIYNTWANVVSLTLSYKIQ